MKKCDIPGCNKERNRYSLMCDEHEDEYLDFVNQSKDDSDKDDE